MSLQAASLRNHFERVRSNKAFETFVILVIILSALTLGAKTYEINQGLVLVLQYLDAAITIVFLIEIVIRMAAENRVRDFFTKAWNIFDFSVVTLSLIPIEESEMVLLGRLLRIFRVLRLISIIPELRVLMNALAKSIPRMGYVVLLMFIIFYIYAAIGSMLFEKINPDLWDNIAVSMLTLFRVVTFEDWTDVMYETMAVYPLSWTYYLSFIFLAAYVFLNMMIGIILSVMQSENEKYNREKGLGEAGEVHWIKEHTATIEQRLERIEALLSARKH